MTIPPQQSSNFTLKEDAHSLKITFPQNPGIPLDRLLLELGALLVMAVIVIALLNILLGTIGGYISVLLGFYVIVGFPYLLIWNHKAKDILEVDSQKVRLLRQYRPRPRNEWRYNLNEIEAFYVWDKDKEPPLIGKIYGLRLMLITGGGAMAFDTKNHVTVRFGWGIDETTAAEIIEKINDHINNIAEAKKQII